MRAWRPRCGRQAPDFKTMPSNPFYYKESSGIRITVRPMYLRDQSEPSARHYVFAYFVRIENVTKHALQLMTRRWLIHDAAGEDIEVKGDGVVGEQPLILPGEVHEYQSFCILKSGEGYMEGHYNFVGPDSEAFRAEIPRFILSASASSSLSS